MILAKSCLVEFADSVLVARSNVMWWPFSHPGVQTNNQSIPPSVASARFERRRREMFFCLWPSEFDTSLHVQGYSEWFELRWVETPWNGNGSKLYQIPHWIMNPTTTPLLRRQFTSHLQTSCLTRAVAQGCGPRLPSRRRDLLVVPWTFDLVLLKKNRSAWDCRGLFLGVLPIGFGWFLFLILCSTIWRRFNNHVFFGEFF